MLSRILLILLLSSAIPNALSQEKADSVALNYLAPEVSVVATRKRVEEANSTVRVIDVERSLHAKGRDLGTMLDGLGFAGVLVNGAAGAASALRFRGLASDHTTLYWQSIPLNSMSLGTCDLSMIPAFFSDQVTIISSAGTSQFANNNFGVAIALSNNNEPSDLGFFRAISSYNTLENSFQGFDLKLVIKPSNLKLGQRKTIVENYSGFKSGSLIARVKMFRQDLKNEFQYLDIYQQGEKTIRQLHNNGLNKGLAHDIEWKWKSGTLGFHQWIQSKDLLLPSQMGHTEAGTAEQSDLVMRSALSYTTKSEKSEWSFSTAYSIESLHFKDKPISNEQWIINSKVSAKSFFNRINHLLKIHRNVMLKTNIAGVIPKVESTNYSNGKATQNWIQAGSAVNFNLGTHKIETDVRMDSRYSSLSPSWSFNYSSSFSKRSLQVIPEAQIARHIRVPDMNELFWVPGGNVELKPESGMNYKCGFNIHLVSTKNYSGGIAMRTFRTIVQDWIQWIPLSGNVWTPVNYKLVRSEGWEMDAYYNLKIQGFNLEMNGRLQQTSARMVHGNVWNEEMAKVISYTPKFTWYADLKLTAQSWSFKFSEKYTSSRFTEEQNLKYRMLPHYFLSGVELGYSRMTTKLDVLTSVNVDNLFNQQYESIRTFAMPGRVVQLNIQIQLHLPNHKPQ
jgi:outer membrane cobalamin receptor